MRCLDSIVFDYLDPLTQNTVLLAGSSNLGEHSHQVVVDGVLLGALRFRCIHACSQLLLDSSTSLRAVSGRSPAVQNRRHDSDARVLLMLVWTTHAEVLDGLQTDRVETSRGTLGRHCGGSNQQGITRIKRKPDRLNPCSAAER